MNRPLLLLSTFALLCAAPSANAKSSDAKLKFDAARPLLTLHTEPVRQHALSDLDTLLRRPVAPDTVELPRGIPIVVYVHGRGNEPRKSFTDTKFTAGFVLQKLERYEISVIGLNWNSKIRPFCLCDRPLENAAESADTFVALVDALRAHRLANPEFWSGRPLILLVHSMGSYVLEAAVRSGRLGDASVFDRLLITSSDSAAAGHASWLAAGALGKEKFIFSNPADGVLKDSIDCENKAVRKANKKRNSQGLAPLTEIAASSRLGQLELPDARTALVADATYVQIPAENTHRYFTHGGQNWNPVTCRIFDSALRGLPVRLDAARRVSDSGSQYVVEVASDKNDICFKGIEARDEEKE